MTEMRLLSNGLRCVWASLVTPSRIIDELPNALWKSRFWSETSVGWRKICGRNLGPFVTSSLLVCRFCRVRDY